MSDELSKAAETLADEWDPEDSDTPNDVAGALTLIDLLRQMSESFDDLPTLVAARALTFARVVNGEEAS